MKRFCRMCGTVHDWFALPSIGVQRFGEDTEALELRQCPQQTTLAEKAGHVFAARHVRIPDVEIRPMVVDATFVEVTP